MSLATQQIRFCRSRDGTRIAYATCGTGPVLVRAAHWVGHLKLDWDNPVWRPWLSMLSRRHTLIRYDARGCGLSDRNSVDFALERHVEDLEAVVDAAGVRRFVLFGIAGGGFISLTYATRHADRVSHLALHGTAAVSKFGRGDVEDAHIQIKAFELGWANENPAFRQLFTSQLLPDATAEQFRAFNDLIRVTTTPANAARILRTFYEADLREVAPRVRCPTLVTHTREDGRVPFEQGLALAGLIPGAQFVPLESRNHLLLEGEPAWRHFVEALDAFLPTAPAEQADVAALDDLTARENEVLERLAQGLDNAAIARHLGISEKTVRNQVSIIFSKLGVNSRAQAIVRARDAGFGRRT
jgi:pimeloyl-ACP methyl ester carboxylesterase/DNA-binding CsgD family transcriptional regulator